MVFNRQGNDDYLKKIIKGAQQKYFSELVKNRFGSLREFTSEDVNDAIRGFTELHFWKEPTSCNLDKLSEVAINDPIHGSFKLPKEIGYLIKQPFFMRMVYIKQLSFAYLSNHGTMHTRFAHSIGVSHLAKKCIDKLKSRENGHKITSEESISCQVAGLIHDIGHGPFGHSLEPLALDFFSEMQGKFKKIDKILGCEYLLENESPLRIALENIDINLELTHKILCEKDSLKEKKYLGDLIDSPLDVDRIDYILRDLAHVKPDRRSASLILDSIDISKFEGTNSLVFGDRCLSDINQLLSDRNYLYSEIYRDPKIIAADEMICRAVHDLISEYNLKDNGLEILKLTDSDLLFILRFFGSERAKSIVEKILCGDHYVPIQSYILDPEDEGDFNLGIYQAALNIATRKGYGKKIIFESDFHESISRELKEKIGNPPEIFLYTPSESYLPMKESKTSLIDDSIDLSNFDETLIKHRDGTIRKMKELENSHALAKFPGRYQIHLIGPKKYESYKNEIDYEFRDFVLNYESFI